MEVLPSSPRNKEPPMRSPTDASEVNKLYYDFFVTFSRFEYAMKKTGSEHYLTTGGGQWPKANWKKLIERSQEFNFENPRVRCAATFLYNNPPQQQCIINEKLDWQNYNAPPNQKVLRAVTTVRNNLFHGGKYIPTASESRGNNHRDQQLVKASLIVLQYCLEQDDHLHAIFYA